MEESEKRRERLKAMRTEAASHAEAGPSPSPCSPYSSSTPPVQLSNPLAQPLPPPTAESTPPRPPRFDFYTDPMASFSGSKRRSYGSGSGGGGGGCHPPENFSSPIRSASSMSHRSPNHSSAGPRNCHMASPPHQFQVNQFPDQSPYGMPLPGHQSGPWRSPVPFASPFLGPRSTPVANPGPLNQSAGAYGQFSHPNSTWGGFMTPGLGRGGSPMSNFGRGGSPHSFSGRGRGWSSGSGASPGRSGGRGRGSYDLFSARRGTQHFYIRTMVKDPWRKLKPVVGNILGPLAGRGSWVLKSLTAKKPRISGGGNEFNSRPSLAEYLASSFEEAIDDADA